MALNNYKASPAISTGTVYEVWKKGIKVSSSFTSYEKRNQAPTTFLGLAGQAVDVIVS